MLLKKKLSDTNAHGVGAKQRCVILQFEVCMLSRLGDVSFPAIGLLPPEVLLEFLVLCETSGLIEFKLPLEELREKVSNTWLGSIFKVDILYPSLLTAFLSLGGDCPPCIPSKANQ